MFPFKSKSNGNQSTNTDNNKSAAVNIPEKTFLLDQGYLITSSRILGEGTYSKVKKAYAKHLRKDVAIKIVNRKNAPKDFVTRFFPRELEIIKDIVHENICKFYDVIDSGTKVYIVMEHAAKGDLLEHIQVSRFLLERDARTLFMRIVSALQYLHSMNILHRDLKCENILLTENMEPLLTDFGFAKYTPSITELNHTYCGSSAYAPVEILKGVPYDGPCAEVWSLGCILYIILTGTMPFDDSNKVEQIKQMKKGPSFSRSKQSLSNEVKTVIFDMLNVDTKERISLDDIASSEWYKMTFLSNPADMSC